MASQPNKGFIISIMQFVIPKLCSYLAKKRNEFRKDEQLFEENKIRYCP